MVFWPRPPSHPTLSLPSARRVVPPVLTPPTCPRTNGPAVPSRADAHATINLTRVPYRYMHNFVTSVIMVFISCLGFLIDPANAPARVTLGVVRQITHWFIRSGGLESGARSPSHMVNPLARVTRGR